MTIEDTSAAGADELDLSDLTAEPAVKPKIDKPTPGNIPDKYKGKSIEDLIQMQENAQRKISEQGEEVRITREWADQILKAKDNPANTSNKQDTRQAVTLDNVLTDPQKAIDDATASGQVGQRVAALEAREAEQKFVTKHPSFKEDMADPEFLSWVQRNNVRKTLAQAAEQNGSFTAATELFDLWEERKQELSGVTRRDADDVETEVQAKPARKVPATVKPAASETQSRAKPIFDRKKIMALRVAAESNNVEAKKKWENEGFQKALNQAYLEDRVKYIS